MAMGDWRFRVQHCPDELQKGCQAKTVATIKEICLLSLSSFTHLCRHGSAALTIDDNEEKLERQSAALPLGIAEGLPCKCGGHY